MPATASTTAAGDSDAVRLFVDRARLVQPAFLLDDRNVADVIGACRAVDGIPLGIELAAARLATATPAELTDLLSDRLGTLVGGGRDIAHRQQTLRATIAWSHDLLTREQQVLFRRLAVFAGAQCIAAIRDVCGFRPIEPDSVRDLVTQLVAKSVVWTRIDGDVTTFGMLQPVREFADERLRESAETDTAAASHHALYARLAGELWQARRHHGARAEHQRLWREIDDVRVALAASPDAVSYMEMATDLFWMWLQYAPNEGFRRLRDAFDRLPDPPRPLLARAGRVLMACAGQIGDYSMFDLIVPRAEAAAADAGDDFERGCHSLQL
ncbi:MAG: ATP-binding protein, partial [Candidatus Dormibacteria bacterium]